jgi:hypothetical protein
MSTTPKDRPAPKSTCEGAPAALDRSSFDSQRGRSSIRIHGIGFALYGVRNCGASTKNVGAQAIFKKGLSRIHLLS